MGLGVTDPDAMLEVAGTTHIQGAVTLDSTLAAGNTTLTGSLPLIIDRGTLASGGFVWQDYYINSAYRWRLSSNATAGSDQYEFDLRNASNASLFTVWQTGQVGLGTRDPAYYLDVRGTLRATGAATLDSDLDVLGDLDITGTSVLDGAVSIHTAAGINYGTGSNVDTDIITVDVTGTPRLYWDESYDSLVMTSSFALLKDLILSTGLTTAPVNVADCRIYRSNASGGAAPFNQFGNLVLQPRTTSAARGIYFMNFASTSSTVVAMSIDGNGDVDMVNDLDVGDALVVENGITSTAGSISAFGSVTAVGSDIIASNGALRLETDLGPGTTGATGTKGQITWHDNGDNTGYLYICVADADWQRVATATW
jgi:hypothetical protein